MASAEFVSPNFGFLAKHDKVLVKFAAQAERYVFDDANTSLFKLRQFAELLAQQAAAYAGIIIDREDSFLDVLDQLWNAGVTGSQVSQLFHGIRKAGNAAAHEQTDDRREALHQLRMARKLAVWFHRSFGGNKKFDAGSFVAPPDPAAAEQELIDELDRLRKAQVAAQTKAADLKATLETELRLKAEAEAQAKRSFDDLTAALELAEESEQKLEAEREAFQKRINELQAKVAATPETERKATAATAFQQDGNLDLDEEATRRIIDAQLRDAGWIVDSETIRHSKGVRPQKNKNMAIAEWPTSTGPADYVLFLGLTPIAVVEAKRGNADVAGSITQAQRYSRSYIISNDEDAPGGPWDEYKIPFLFSTNGRDYLKQIKTKSGIWFHDARHGTNLPRAIVGWYSPDGLRQRLKQDVAAANEQLASESTEYLPLRYYQRDAIAAVEQGIANGQREMLVAMATGTGKTRTCIALCYRLIKANRFRRILFLVDRTSLGEQTADSLTDLRIENNQSFSDIYDVKQLGDIKPDSDTKFQIATIQGMVRRLLESDNADEFMSVDQYDCIVVDECHRGYNLDQEMTEGELRFRSEAEYISKYSRVIDYFDAFKIGLTATPALHTLEIFGGKQKLPIYQYSYQQAVIDGYLVDYEPPLRIGTRLGENGIRWQVGEQVQVYDTAKRQLDLFQTPDEIDLQIDSFNRKVLNENFNRVICEELAKHIDPSLPGKTLVFCVTDSHCDTVVDQLRLAFQKQYGSVKANDVIKITSNADKPLQLIRLFKNESSPKVVVTVDLLTTGIDVPAIDKLVFLRRVRSRILYDQMLGRGTRLCPNLHGPDEDKGCFHIFDCIDLYSALQSYTDMKPVVAKPSITISQLVTELSDATTDEDREEIKRQLVAKLQRKKRLIRGDRAKEFEAKAGTDAESLVQQIKISTPEEIAKFFSDKSALVDFLDTSKSSGGLRIYVSNHDDEVTEVARGYGKNNVRPKDYLEEFRDFAINQQDRIEALKLCATRPRDLTRQTLKELKIELDNEGFSETMLKVAWRETTNVEIAATIIGYVRNAILDAPLLPFDQRVDSAMNTIMSSQNWTNPQRKWLQRIGKQFKENTLVDREALDSGTFSRDGGFDRLNKMFDGQLNELLGQIMDEIWGAAA